MIGPATLTVPGALSAVVSNSTTKIAPWALHPQISMPLVEWDLMYHLHQISIVNQQDLELMDPLLQVSIVALEPDQTCPHPLQISIIMPDRMCPLHLLISIIMQDLTCRLLISITTIHPPKWAMPNMVPTETSMAVHQEWTKTNKCLPIHKVMKVDHCTNEVQVLHLDILEQILSLALIRATSIKVETLIWTLDLVHIRVVADHIIQVETILLPHLMREVVTTEEAMVVPVATISRVDLVHMGMVHPKHIRGEMCPEEITSLYLQLKRMLGLNILKLIWWVLCEYELVWCLLRLSHTWESHFRWWYLNWVWAFEVHLDSSSFKIPFLK
jgi:hypothetical protein